MDSSYQTLSLERSDQGWAVLALNRPEQLNTLSIALRKEFDRAIRELEADAGVHILILTGTGKAFSAGLDLKDWDAGERPAAEAYHWDPVASLQRFSGPVIAAVNGLTVTGGVELVLACDMILASDQARFADTHVRVGLLPGWGGSVRLIERVGLLRAKELALTGRFFSAQEALRWGFVNDVVPHADLLPRARALAQEMLKARPEDLARYKRLLDEESRLPLPHALQREREASQALSETVSAQDLLQRLARLRQDPTR
jgi:enoyl-CoA hydratase